MLNKEKEFYFNKLISEGRKSIIWNAFSLIDGNDYEIRLADNNKSNLLLWLYADNKKLFCKNNVIRKASLKSINYKNKNKEDIFDLILNDFEPDNFRNTIGVTGFIDRLYNKSDIIGDIFLGLSKNLDVFHDFLVAGFNINLLDKDGRNIFYYFTSSSEINEAFLEENLYFFKTLNINNQEKLMEETLLMNVFRNFHQNKCSFLPSFLMRNFNIDYEIINNSGENALFYAGRYQIDSNITVDVINKTKNLDVQNIFKVDVSSVLHFPIDVRNAYNYIVSHRNLCKNVALVNDVSETKINKI